MNLKNLNKLVELSKQSPDYKRILIRAIERKIKEKPSSKQAMIEYAKRINITQNEHKKI